MEEDYDNDYEEVEDFDPEYSVFGSEKVIEKKESVLGKRARDDGLTIEQFEKTLNLQIEGNTNSQ